MLRRLAASLDRLLALLLALLIAVMVLTVTWQVFSRDVFNDPSGWTEELARFLLIWIGLFGGALAYRRGLHLGLDLLAERLKNQTERARHWHAIGIDFCVLIFAMTILVGGGTSLVMLTRELEQFSPALGLPMAVVYLALPASGLLMAIFALAALAYPAVESRRISGID